MVKIFEEEEELSSGWDYRGFHIEETPSGYLVTSPIFSLSREFLTIEDAYEFVDEYPEDSEESDATKVFTKMRNLKTSTIGQVFKRNLEDESVWLLFDRLSGMYATRKGYATFGKDTEVFFKKEYAEASRDNRPEDSKVDYVLHRLRFGKSKSYEIFDIQGRRLSSGVKDT